MTESRPRQSATFRSPAYRSSQSEEEGDSKKAVKKMHSHTAIYLSFPLLLHFLCPSFWQAAQACLLFILWLALLR